MTEEELRLKSIDTALEWTKQIITLAAGILVVSGTFIKELFGGKVSGSGWLVVSWVSICLSIVFGILFLGALCSTLARKKPADVDLYSQPGLALGFIHFSAFLAAVVSFAVFAWKNLKSVEAPLAPTTPAAPSFVDAMNPNCLQVIGTLAGLGGIALAGVALVVAICALGRAQSDSRSGD